MAWPETAARGWRRSLEPVYTDADLKRNSKKLRAPTHMLRRTVAIEKLNAGASPEDVSLLLGHHSIKITERHYLRFDQLTGPGLFTKSRLESTRVGFPPAKSWCGPENWQLQFWSWNQLAWEAEAGP